MKSPLQDQVDLWIAEKSKDLIFPVYSSLDLRIAPYKASVVDVNLFPCGFNNLCNTMIKLSSEAFDTYIRTHYAGVKTIAVFCESHTRNNFYFLNLKAIYNFISKAGYICLFVHPDLEGDREGLHFSRDHLAFSDIVISNNDFSDGYSPLLENLSIPVIPHRSLIWATRRKSGHFSILRDLATELGGEIDQDPWLFSCEFEVEHDSDLRDSTSIARIKEKAVILFDKLKLKYAHFGINATPSLFIKDDAGTYGMGIMTIQSPDDLDHLSRKTINKMHVGKQHIIQDLLIQEGVPSLVRHLGAVAEPVLYCVGSAFVGSFLRVNPLRDELANLNAKGMEFFRLCEQEDKDIRQLPPECCGLDIMTDSARIAAKLSLLAAAVENTRAFAS